MKYFDQEKWERKLIATLHLVQALSLLSCKTSAVK